MDPETARESLVDRLLRSVESSETRFYEEILVEREKRKSVTQKANRLAKKIIEFEYEGTVGDSTGNKKYRLVARAKHTPGYEDVYIIEREGVDELGEKRWDRYTEFNRDEHNRGCELRLIAALKAAQRESRGEVVDKVAKFIRDSAENIEDSGTSAALLAIADAVLEGRPFE